MDGLLNSQRRSKLMNDKLFITTFTDPMMGLSYESMPVFRKLETHFGDRIVFGTKMAGLVRDVYDLVDYNDLKMYGKTVALNKYKAKLAEIYLQEERIAHMPIIMNNFRLFDEEHTSSLPLNRAYKAVELIDETKSDQFLYNLRYSTVVETNPTTHTEELVKVAGNSGIDPVQFLETFKGEKSQKALDKDFEIFNILNVNTLPAYLLQYKDQAALVTSIAKYEDFIQVINKLTKKEIRTKRTKATVQNIYNLIKKHPLISSNELIAAFGLKDNNDLLNRIAPLVNDSKISVKKVKDSYFIADNK